MFSTLSTGKCSLSAVIIGYSIGQFDKIYIIGGGVLEVVKDKNKNKSETNWFRVLNLWDSSS